MVRFLSILCVSVLFSLKVWAGVSVDVPLDHWTYQVLERFATRGLVDVRSLSTRPLNRMQMARLSRQAVNALQEFAPEDHDPKYLSSLSEDLDKLLEEFKQEMVFLGEMVLNDQDQLPDRTQYRVLYPLRLERVIADLDDGQNFLLRNRNGWLLEDGTNLRLSLRTWVKIEDYAAFSVEPAIYYNETNNTEEIFEEAYGRTQIGNWQFSIGRASQWWGPGFNGSLVLSNNATATDTIKVRNDRALRLPGPFRYLGDVDLNFFISELKDDRAVPEAKLAGFRSTFAPHAAVTLGFSKVVMAGGERDGGSLEADDLFKAFFFANENEIGKANNNQITMFDWMWRVRNRMLFYGQWAFDGEERGGFSKPAVLLGTTFADVFNAPGLSLRFEYAQTDRDWYEHNLYSTGFRRKGQLIGHFMGGDARNILVRVEQQGVLRENLDMGLSYDYVESGRSLALPEERQRWSFDLKLFKTSLVQVRLAYIFERIENFSNQSSSDKDNHIFELSGRAEF